MDTRTGTFVDRSLPPLPSLLADLRSGRRAIPEVLEHQLARAESAPSTLQAWARRAEPAELRTAAQGAESVWSALGVGVKDIFDVRGWPTAAGCPEIAGATLAQQDAELVSWFRRLACPILGKTATTPFACFDPSPTRNPWNMDHTPGGSSSGSAAAVAAGMCLIGLASQTGGSISRPATYCGVAGLKPTFGHWARRGVFPVSFSLDHVGLIARTACDLATWWDALHSQPQAARIQNARSTRLLNSSLAGSLILPQEMMSYVDEEIRQAFQQAIETMSAATPRCQIRPEGNVFWLEDGRWASVEDVLNWHRCLMNVEAADIHRQAFERKESSYPAGLASIIRAGLATSGESYRSALQAQVSLRVGMRQRWAGEFLVLPATTSTAPAGLASTGDPRMNSPWSFLGWPTVSFSPGTCGPSGLPWGIQLVGPPGSEAELLDLASRWEARLGNALGLPGRPEFQE